jgi:subtilase family serine protease
MLFHRARHAARKGRRSLKSPARPLRLRPQLEELETRNLLSVSTTTTAVDPSLTSTSQTTTATATTTNTTSTTSTTSTAWASLTAQPDLTVTTPGATPDAGSGGYVYYTPAQIRQAYGISQAVLPNGQAATGAGQTIAIVDAFNDPNIASDLATFDNAYGLPAASLQVVQVGGAGQTNTSWSYETSLDVEWAHAVAPQANILLVEAATNSYSNLLAGVEYAASQPGVVAVSMSWGSSEFYNETSLDSTFTTPAGHVGGSGLPGGVTFVASAGDSGAWSGAQWPASSPDVLAVGGTSLYLTGSNNYSSESAWLYGGGGYSHYEWEPSYQYGAQTSGWRTSPDVSYDANPNTGFVIYDSLNLPAGDSGWWLSGGTSAGAPQWAAIMALADQARAVNGLGSLGNGQQDVYSLPSSDFNQVTSGTNGYAATAGYNMATGLGSPIVNRVVASLADLGGSAQSNTASSNHATGGFPTHPFDAVSSLPVAGPAPGAAGSSSTAPADPAAETVVPASSGSTGQEAPAVSVEKSPSPAAIELTPTVSQVSPVAPETPPPVNPATDAVFCDLGATGWDAPDSPWSVSPAWLHGNVSEDVTPELAGSFLLGQGGDALLFDAAAADGADA